MNLSIEDFPFLEKTSPILVFMEKQGKKQVEMIEQVCDELSIDVDQILA